MISLILMQKTGGDSLSGIGGNSGGLNSVISSKASANFLTRATMVVAAFFMINCLALSLVSSKISKSSQLEIDKIIDKQNQPASIQDSNNKAK